MDERVSAELCFAPCRSYGALGSHGTNPLGPRLSHAPTQTVTDCCHAGAKKSHFSADDVITCRLPNLSVTLLRGSQQDSDGFHPVPTPPPKLDVLLKYRYCF